MATKLLKPTDKSGHSNSGGTRTLRIEWRCELINEKHVSHNGWADKWKEMQEEAEKSFVIVYSTKEVDSKTNAIDKKIVSETKKVSDSSKASVDKLQKWTNANFASEKKVNDLNLALNKTIEKKIGDVIKSINSLPVPPTAEELSSQINEIVNKATKEQFTTINTEIAEIKKKLSEINAP